MTGANGRFRILAVPPGRYILVVRRLGFALTSASLRVAEAVNVAGTGTVCASQ